MGILGSNMFGLWFLITCLILSSILIAIPIVSQCSAQKTSSGSGNFKNGFKQLMAGLVPVLVIGVCLWALYAYTMHVAERQANPPTVASSHRTEQQEAPKQLGIIWWVKDDGSTQKNPSVVTEFINAADVMQIYATYTGGTRTRYFWNKREGCGTWSQPGDSGKWILSQVGEKMWVGEITDDKSDTHARLFFKLY